MSLDITLRMPFNMDRIVVKNNEVVMPLSGSMEDLGVVVYDTNITHNCHVMAEAAGLGILWDGDDYVGLTAFVLIPYLIQGIEKMKASPATYGRLEPSNGWGTLSQFLRFTEELLIKCSMYPQAEISISR
jgi:hypothetical protein